MADRGELTKAGTMDLTAKDGKAFLEKNLTEWKKPGLLGHFEDKEGAGSSTAAKGGAKGGVKGKKGAAAKKAKMAKAGTMVATAKEGNDLLAGEKLGDTREMTKNKKKPAGAAKGGAKRADTMHKTLEEAKALCGPINTSEGRKLRKRAAPSAPSKQKTPLKKAKTMAKTAKEGKAYLKKAGPLTR